jgi:hypothetical protein
LITVPSAERRECGHGGGKVNAAVVVRAVVVGRNVSKGHQATSAVFFSQKIDFPQAQGQSPS